MATERIRVTIPAADKQRLIAAWRQFDTDLENYQHVEVIPAAVAAPQMALPALSVQIDGAIQVRDNLSAFSDALRTYIEGINRKPETDQDFADLEASAKLLREAQERIKAEKDRALGSIDAIDTMKRMADAIEDLARITAIELERLVDAEKKNRRAAIVAKAQSALDAHIAMLNDRIGKPWMPRPLPDFAGAIKGKKTLTSVQEATDQALANSKIAANEIADKIEINFKRLRELAVGHETLFPDAQQIVMKDADSMAAIVKQRIADHRMAEEARRDREIAQKKAAPVSFLAPQLPADTPTPDTGKRLTLGEINGKLGVVTITTSGMSSLGFDPIETRKAVKLYRECDFPAICDAIIARIMAVKGST